MPRQSSTDLFELIRSLTPSEKRSFRMQSEKEGSPLYLRLYTAIEKQVSYNEDRVLESVKGLRPSQLSNLKAYLYDIILRHLCELRTSKEEKTWMYNALSQADVLYDKGLYTQCNELLKKLEKLCREKDSPLLLLAVIEREINLVKKNGSQWHLLEEKYAEKKEIVAYISRTDSYRYVRDIIGTFVSHAGTVRNDEDRKRFRSFRSLLPEEREISSDNERKIYHNVMYRYHFAMCEHEDAYLHIKNLVEIHNHSPEKSLFNYLLYLANQAELCILLGKYEEAQKVLEAIRSTKAASPREALRITEYYYNYSISLSNATGNFNRSVALANEFRVSPGMDAITGLSIAFYTATAFFCMGDLHNALRQVNTVINHPKTPALWHLQCLTRVLNLLVHYELGNDSLLAGNLRSTYRYLMQKGFLDPFEEVILEFVRKFCRHAEPGDEKKLLKEMYHKLWLVLKQERGHRFNHSHYHITLALRSRLEKRPVTDLLDEAKEPSDNR